LGRREVLTGKAKFEFLGTAKKPAVTGMPLKKAILGRVIIATRLL
jgi:hypothetical protein